VDLTDKQGLNAMHITVVGREAGGPLYEEVMLMLIERSRVCVCLCVYIDTYIHTYSHTHTYIFIHIYIYQLSLSLSLSHTHTHTHTCICRSQLLGQGLAKAATVHGDTPLHFMAQMAEEASFRPV
jgi:hypothetical protein